MFRRESFVPQGVDRRTFHDLALNKGRLWEEQVAQNFSSVFEKFFPELIKTLYKNDPDLLIYLTINIKLSSKKLR